MSNQHRFHSVLVLVLLLLSAAAGAAAESLPGFKLEGAKWTYHDGQLSMKGFLIKPNGDGPFPAILISHGRGGTAESFGMQKAREFVKMGFVCIAPDYTHAGPVGGGGKKGGKKGATSQKGETAGEEKKGIGFAVEQRGPGASDENLRRAIKCLDILQSLAYVDAKRLAAYGNSMGAFVTISLSAKESKRLKASAITAGGIGYRNAPAAASEGMAAGVPLCILHGGSDATVPPESSVWLKELLDKNKVPNERHLFEGIGHNLHQEKAAEVLQLMKAWFTKYGVLKPS